MKTPYLRNVPILDKLIQRYQTKGTCWEWTAGKDSCGYGRIWYNGKNSTAHTVAYSVFVAPVPEGKHVLHTCDNPCCINPDHLELGTHMDNMQHKVIRNRVKGEQNPNAKFTDEQREIARTSTGSPKELSKQLGMSASYICNLRKMHKFA